MGRRRSLQALLAALAPLGLADNLSRRSSTDADSADSSPYASPVASSSSSAHSPEDDAPPSPLPDFLNEDPFAPPPPPVALSETAEASEPSYFDEMDSLASYYAPPPPPPPSVALPSEILARSTMKSDSRNRTPSLVELTNARLPQRMVRRGRVGAQLPVEPWADAENACAAPVPVYTGRLAVESCRPSRRARTVSAPSVPIRPSPLHAASRGERAVARSKSATNQPSPLSRAL